MSHYTKLNDRQKQNISEGVKRAHKAKALRGEHIERPTGTPILDRNKLIIANMIGRGIKAKRVAKEFYVSPATLSRWMRLNKIKIQ